MEVDASLAVTRPFLMFAAANFVSTDQRRRNLAGINFCPHPEGGVLLVATNGNRLLLIWDKLGFFSGRSRTWYGQETVIRKLHARKRATLDEANLVYLLQDRAPFGEILLVQDSNLRTVQETWEKDDVSAQWEILATGTPPEPLYSPESFDPWRQVFPRVPAEVTTQGAPYYQTTLLIDGLMGLAPLRPRAVQLVPQPVKLPLQPGVPTFRGQGGVFRIISELEDDFEAVMLMAPMTASERAVRIAEEEWLTQVLDAGKASTI